MHPLLEPCQLYTGKLTKLGYPVVAQRLWREFFGDYPKHLEVDHLCCNPACIHPKHLQLVTHKENLRRVWMRQTHCKIGVHPKTIENTYKTNTGRLACKPCMMFKELRRTISRRLRRGKNKMFNLRSMPSLNA